MAQALFCSQCRVAYTAALRGHSCPACGEELIHGRLSSGSTAFRHIKPKRSYASRAVWDHIIKRDPCVYCGDKSTTVDHIQPKALGGSKGVWSNRAGCCFRCNQEKAHTPLLMFLLERVGVDVSALKDDSGRWPIEDPDERVIALTELEESLSQIGREDPRKILLDEGHLSVL